MISIRDRTPSGSSHPSQSPRTRSNATTSVASVITEQEGALVPRTVPARRTLDDVRSQVAQEIAMHCITKARVLDGVKINVRFVMSMLDDEDFLRQIAECIQYQMPVHQHLFILAAALQNGKSGDSPLLIRASDPDYVQRATLLVSSKFIGRIVSAESEGDQWMATIADLGMTPYDEDALWDVLHKSARSPIDPLLPPPGSKSIDEKLAEARAKLQRITPSQALEELRESQVGAPTYLVDIRPVAQREAEGGINGSLIVERNVLEWRFDPRSSSRLTIADRYDLRIIIFCQEGYASSLAAYSLQQLGLLNATDVIGGYQDWKDDGLPVDLHKRGPQSSYTSQPSQHSDSTD